MIKKCFFLFSYRKANVDHQVLVVGGLCANLGEKAFSLKKQNLQIMRVKAFDLYTCRLCY